MGDVYDALTLTAATLHKGTYTGERFSPIRCVSRLRIDRRRRRHLACALLPCVHNSIRIHVHIAECVHRLYKLYKLRENSTRTMRSRRVSVLRGGQMRVLLSSRGGYIRSHRIEIVPRTRQGSLQTCTVPQPERDRNQFNSLLSVAIRAQGRRHELVKANGEAKKEAKKEGATLVSGVVLITCSLQLKVRGFSRTYVSMSSSRPENLWTCVFLSEGLRYDGEVCVCVRVCYIQCSDLFGTW